MKSCCEPHNQPNKKLFERDEKLKKAGALWTCPMHTEVIQDGPGNCPKCGMALKPK